MSEVSSPQRRGMWAGLLWKESRQLLPLLLILITVCLLLIVCWSGFFDSRRDAAVQIRYLPLILPSLFAVGAAAVLVGQEREQRTLGFLTSLPIPPSLLIRAKFAVAIVGLAVMWLLCWVLNILAGFSDTSHHYAWPPQAANSNAAGICLLHLHSVFILMCGFFTAWTFKNTFASLIAVVPLALVPFSVRGGWYALREQIWGYRFIGPTGSTVTTMIVTIPAIAIVGWLGYRAAWRSLAPAEPPRTTTPAPARWLEGWRSGASIPVPETPYRFSLSSLVWQSVHHNRLILAGLVTMIGMGFVGLLVRSYSGIDQPEKVAVILFASASALGVCWLGVFAFTGDGGVRRLQFLAERGVSPTKVLTGRHLVGLSILSSLLMLYTWCSYQLPDGENDTSLILPSAAAVAIVVWVLYSVSQWTSQLVPMLATSAILAPVLSFFAVYWLGFAAVELDAPLWLIVLTGSLPMIATWLMMRRFMDGSRRWPIWLTGAITVFLFGFLPVIPLAVDIARIPTMPAEVRASLLAEAKQLSRDRVVRLPVSLIDTRLSIDPEIEFDAAWEQLESQSFHPIDRLLIPRSDSRSPTHLSIDQNVVNFALSIATYEKVRFLSSPSDESAVDSLAEWITTLTTLARGLRASRALEDQGSADKIEIWLTQTLASPPVRALRDREFYLSAVDLISDASARSAARRRSLLVSWYRWRQMRQGKTSAIGVYNFVPQIDPLSTTQYVWMNDRLTEAFMHSMLRLTELGSAGKPTEAVRRELHHWMIGSSMDFSDGPYADRSQVSANGPAPFPNGLRYLASQWYAPWENDATRLASGSEDDRSAERAPTGETP